MTWTMGDLAAKGFVVEGAPGFGRATRRAQEPCSLPDVSAVAAGSDRAMRTGVVRLVLPYPPTVNHYWRQVAGRVVLSRPGRDYRTRVQVAVQQQQPVLYPFAGPVRAEVVAHAPDRRRRDIDNICKALADALTHAGVYQDDSQIVDLSARWGIVVQPGYVEVTLSAADLISPICGGR